MSQNKKTINEEDALESALSPIVNKLIDKNFESSGDKIASQMAPLIGGAIREQIKSQKDDIVDALYPVMGNMISKFVTKSLEDLLNKINEQIQNGLSTQAIKRKIKAKLKGVSETELLLEESSEADIKAVLLIHKESGSLLCKVEGQEGQLSDADMLASMMSAIRSFVNEWISANESDHELGEIEYGGNKIIIETSGYSYLAVIVEGAAYTKTYEKIRTTLSNLIEEHGQEIKNFQGNFEELNTQAIKQELQKLLTNNSKKRETQKKKSPLLFLIPLILISYFGYLSYQSYKDEELQEKITKVLQHTPQLLPFKIDVTVDDMIVTIKGSVPFSYHKELIQKKLKTLLKDTQIKNEIQVIPTLTDPMQVSSNIAYLLKGVNLDPKTNINYNFDYNTLTLFGTTSSIKKKKEILQAIQNIKGIQSVSDSINVVIPTIDAQIYFEKSSTSLNDTTKKQLKKIANLLKENSIDKALELKAYSDMIGNKTKNRALAQKRVRSIINFLKEENITNKIEITIFDTPPPDVDPKKDPSKARQIRLRLKNGADNV